MNHLNKKYKKVAETTLNAIKNGKYTTPMGDICYISEAIEDAVNRSKLYTDITDYNASYVRPNYKPEISVTNESTLEACYRLRLQNPVALNFANATEPGGGFLRGAIAQEETIARSSALYNTLLKHPKYFNDNKKNGTYYYLDNVIYSPDVPIIKNDDGNWLEHYYTASFITSPAPMRTLIEQSSIVDDEIEDKLFNTFLDRTRRILEVAMDNNHRTIVLGAWGCGAFGNDPVMVSDTFDIVLKELPYFDNIVFAIYDDKNSNTYLSFQDLFDK